MSAVVSGVLGASSRSGGGVVVSSWLDPDNMVEYDASGLPTSITTSTETDLEFSTTGTENDTIGVSYPSQLVSPSDFSISFILENKGGATGGTTSNLAVVRVSQTTHGNGAMQFVLRNDHTNPSVVINSTTYYATDFTAWKDTPTTFETVGDCSSSLYYIEVTQGESTQSITISNNPILAETGALSVYCKAGMEIKVNDFSNTGA